MTSNSEGKLLTYAELVELHDRIYNEAGIYVEPYALDRIQRAHVAVERQGVTPAGMPWRG